jgi:hypothetical protein
VRPLVDSDILVYEVASAAEVAWMSGGVAPFDYVEGLIEGSVLAICEAVGATEPPLMFLSTDRNFRYDIAVTKPYKGNRKHDSRPFHYDNIRAYIPARWDTIICDGYEADDGLAMYQLEALKRGETSIICSRDKDLRQIPGWHYTWARGFQAESGPDYVDEFGELSLTSRVVVPTNPDKRPYTKYKCRGSGLKWFYAQCLMGDVTDNIPGLKGTADLKAYELLNEAKTEEECHKIVLDSYNNIYGNDEGATRMLEQARLVWMVRSLDPEGRPVMWNLKGE